MRHHVHLTLAFLILVRLDAVTVRRPEPTAKAALISRLKPKFRGDRQECPSLFAAVLTTEDGADRRSQIRKMWQEAGDGYGRVKAKFAICTGQGVSEALEVENREHDDLLLMPDCEEGYTSGVLTQKVASTMKAYLESFSDDYDLYMKVDDDTFVSTRRFCDLLTWRTENHKDNMAAYFGVFAEGPHEAIQGVHIPIRDPDSPWYEPYEKFSGDAYPVSAKGGPGYVLSRRLVKPIINDGIASANVLNNEDKAVGVWVDLLVQRGEQVDIVNVPGTDGYDEHKDSFKTSGPYKDYKAALHHHLSGKRIACLHEVDRAEDPQQSIDHCFDTDL